jgi:uncharacterized Zn finger protein
LIGAQLRRTYVVTLQIDSISDQLRARATNSICAQSSFIPLLRAGAAIQEVYVKANGSPIGTILITRKECGL